jgi:hypothetical protein
VHSVCVVQDTLARSTCLAGRFAACWIVQVAAVAAAHPSPQSHISANVTARHPRPKRGRSCRPRYLRRVMRGSLVTTVSPRAAVESR